jgi:glycosyltransferase involved in cell wall biosynthesis
MAPIVSVLMATHNDAAFLRSAMDSILGQTFTDFEFIIINDASIDDTSAILDSYSDPRIVRLENDANLKLAASLNRGLEAAQGEFIARMDSDDISLPERLEKQIGYLTEYPEIGILGTRYYRIDSGGEILGESNQPLTHGLIIWEYLSRLAYPLLHPTTVMRRELLVHTGGYNEDYPREQDGELFLRLIHSAKYANLPENLYLHRSKRSRTMASEVFEVSYAATVEIRRKCVASLLERDVSLGELRALIFPTSRRHRQRAGIELSLPQVKSAINLLLDIFSALDKRGYFDKEERAKAQGEISDLTVNMLRFCEEFAFEACNRVSSYKVAKYLCQRVYRTLHQHSI